MLHFRQPTAIVSLMNRSRELLRDRGLRATIGRREILDAFRRADRPLSLRELRDTLPGAADRSTFYRVVGAMEKAGLIHRVLVAGRSPAFELAERCGDAHCHPHFSCRACGQTTCLEGITVSTRGTAEAGLLVERRKILLEGLCGKCR
jgi:Fur family ferric uptake transcriptional regulator